MWSKCLYPEQVEKVNHIKSIRQVERQLRWNDTPQFIMNNPKGYCFITSSWMAEWEMFLEGWTTEPPTAVIDQTILLSSIAQLSSVRSNPFYLHSADSVMIISKDTWDYISQHYSVNGQQITKGIYLLLVRPCVLKLLPTTSPLKMT
ncbi:hypothetical protein BD408DRAFT_340397 [Parasitella parasitica]|nr:hypothetical protein BD408DRAFT_340397 [Parasitella parasitica]